MTPGSLEIRNPDDDEVVDFIRVTSTAFGHVMREADVEFRRTGIDYTRAPSAFMDGELVGTSRSFPVPLTLPGLATVGVAAVTAVAVLPTHRRRGVLSAMMAHQLEDVAARGEVAAILIASEAPIYERFGYGCAARQATMRIDSSKVRFRQPVDLATRMVDPSEIEAVGRPLHEAHRRRQPGSIGRTDRWWDIFTGRRPLPDGSDPHLKRFHVACDGGWCSYRVKENWQGMVPEGTIEVDELVATTPEAYAALWQHVLAVDLVTTVTAGSRPVVEPVPLLLTDRRRAAPQDVSDFLWARLLDVPAALAARTYGEDGSLVLEVVDRFRPAYGGRFGLSVDGGEVSCAPTEGPPDLVLETADLGAAWLGDAPLWMAAAARRVEEHTHGAVDRFDRLFLTARPPWCDTWF